MESIEDIDLTELVDRLRAAFPSGPVGYLRGKTALRNALEEALGCSELEAETLVDTLEARGLVQFEGNPSEASEADTPWRIG